MNRFYVPVICTYRARLNQAAGILSRAEIITVNAETEKDAIKRLKQAASDYYAYFFPQLELISVTPNQKIAIRRG